MANKRTPKPKLLKLDLACGQRPEPGFKGVDLLKTSDYVVDLLTFPWPFKGASVAEARCSHFVEHIPLANTPTGQDMFFAFFDELDRVLVPGGKATIISPYYSSMRAWQDPTHRRPITEITFCYLNAEWRKENRLDHYDVACDFKFEYGYVTTQEWAAKAEEARQFAIAHYINVVSDISVTLTKREG